MKKNFTHIKVVLNFFNMYDSFDEERRCFVNEPDKDKSEKRRRQQRRIYEKKRIQRHQETKVQLQVMNKFYIYETIVL